MPAVSVAGRLLRTWEWTSFRIGVCVVAVAVFVVRLWSVSHWSWNNDDWIYMERTRSLGFVHYLFQNYNGHVMPGEFLIQWVITKVAPLDFAAPVILVPLASVLVVGIWAVALRELFGERLRLLVPLALLSLTPLQLQSTIWWAAALQSVSLQAALGLCVLFAALLARRPERRVLVGLLLSFAFGLLMWQKDLLLLIPVVAVLLFAHPGTLRERLSRIWRPVLLLGLMAAVYLGGYVALVRGQPTSLTPITMDGARSVRDVLVSYGQALTDLLAPGVLGGPWATLPTESDFDAGPGSVQLVVTIALVSLSLLALLVVRRGAWLPLLMVAGYGALSWGLVVFTSRFGSLQWNRVGYERYAIDTFVVGCLALAMLITPGRLETSGAWRWSPHPRASPGGTLLGTRVGWVVVGCLGLSLVVGNVTAVNRIGQHPTKPWLAALTTDIDKLAPVSIRDGFAPDRVLFPGFWLDSAKLSRMLSPLHQQVEFNAPAETLYVVLPNGHLRPAAIGDASHSAPGPVNGCGFAVGQGTPQDVQMTRDLYDFEWGLQVDTLAGGGGTLRVEIGGKSIDMKIGKGLRRTQAVFTGPVTDARLSVTGRSGTICVADLVVGTITPAPPG